ncbi:MAG: alpha/beta hydrolase [Bacteroidota bacterium]
MMIPNRIARLSAGSFFFLICCLSSFGQSVALQECGFVSAGKLKIYYCEQGKGPAVVFLHAGFLDMHQWDLQVAALSKTRRVITLDLPGHGQSIGNDTSIRIAEVINRVLIHLKISSASFVGMSLGASCAVDFALAHPEKTSRLLLCSPGLNGWEDVMKMDSLSKRVYIRSDIFVDTHEPEQITENYVHFWLDGPYRKIAPVDSSVRKYVYTTAIAKVHKGAVAGPSFDRKKAAKRVQLIRKPVTIIYGSLDIPFIVNLSKYLNKKIKGSQLRVIDGAAHLFTLEKPVVFEQYLKSWGK